MIAWNTALIFEHAGDTKGVLELIAKVAPTAPPPSYATVSVWKHRGRISAEWLPVVLCGLLASGRWPAGADLFINVPDKPDPDAIDDPAAFGL